jgi:mevalonate kinase
LNAPLHLHPHGKLLLTGEYFVLDGALALAVPTKLGQPFTIQQQSSAQPLLQWTSKTHDGSVWFEGVFELPSLRLLRSTDQATAERLGRILQAIQHLNANFWVTPFSYLIETQLEFPRDWGLGSSSTLVAGLSKWASVDPFSVLAATFGGSGYDLACAFAPGPLLFQRLDGQPHHVHFPYDPSFKGQLYFVHLGKKQNSREGIARYRAMAGPDRAAQIQRIDALTAAFLQASDLATAEAVIEKHERIVAEALQLKRAQDLYFSDYWGAIKSLGAWGGDFVLATSNRSPEDTKAYFNKSGFSVVLEYENMV